MALYNGGFPATYQPMYPAYTPIQPQQQQAPAQHGGINWIQGEQAAKSYLVAPNSSVVLFDSEASVVYIKSADASGMPSMKVLDYTIRDSAQNAPSQPSNSKVENYATKEDIEALRGQIDSLRMRIGKLAKKEETADE